MTTFVRVLGAVLGAIIAVQVAALRGPAGGLFEPSTTGTILLVSWVAAWIAVGFLILPHLTIGPAVYTVRRIQELSTAEFVTAVAGLLLGLLMGLLLGLPLSNFPDPYGRLLPIGTSAVMGLGMLGLTVAKREDLRVALVNAGFLDRTPPPAPPAPGPAEVPLIVDTSVFIDGRLPDIAASGFLLGTLLIPGFVLRELQHIADSSDAPRRARGRRGLEAVAAIQRDGHVPVEVTDQDFPALREVDAKLVALARERGAAVITTDYNLNQVATAQGIRVLNLHSLANAVKPSFVPGDLLRIRVVQEGKEPGQGVGYLDDGTMIVVEGGARHLEREVEVAVTRVRQTVAGRMIFAQPRPTEGTR